jgi:hypothetical protein
MCLIPASQMGSFAGQNVDILSLAVNFAGTSGHFATSTPKHLKIYLANVN